MGLSSWMGFAEVLDLGNSWFLPCVFVWNRDPQDSQKPFVDLLMSHCTLPRLCVLDPRMITSSGMQ